jgi:hypothetical protein
VVLGDFDAMPDAASMSFWCGRLRHADVVRDVGPAPPPTRVAPAGWLRSGTRPDSPGGRFNVMTNLSQDFGYSFTLLGRARRGSGWRRPVHAVLSVLLGLTGLVEAGLVAVFVFRGVLYGIVDKGPYTDAWGGPTLAGAWTVHFLVGVAVLAGAVLLGLSVTALHRRLTLWSEGGEVARWVLPCSTGVCLVIALSVAAWTRQI